MYELLHDFARRPAPFSRDTVKELWTRPHLARQMLRFHLDADSHLASRRAEAIERTVAWIDGQIELSGKRVCDLGCGPGLYARRFASRGARVTGVDFSAYSLSYAKRHGAGKVTYIEADYLSDDLPAGFDVVTLIYTDLCALSPQQRAALLARMRGILNPRGRIVLDVAGTGSLFQKQEKTEIQLRLMNGFWAPGDYVGIHRVLLYPEQCLSLDRYLIVEPDETWQIYNWTQHFTAEGIEAELGEAGFVVDQMTRDFLSEPPNPESDVMFVVASAIESGDRPAML